MPSRGRFRQNDQSDEARVTREFLTYVRGNQRLHEQMVESMARNERNIFSLVRPQQLGGGFSLPSPSLLNTAAAAPPLFSSEPWNMFTPPSVALRVPLTIDEISSATVYVAYSSIPEESRIYSECPITMNSFEDDTVVMRIRGCRHYFSPHSLRTHLANHDTCPYCRFDIRRSLLEVVGTGIAPEGTTSPADAQTAAPDSIATALDLLSSALSSPDSTNLIASTSTGASESTSTGASAGADTETNANASASTNTNARNAEVFYQIANRQ